MQVDVQAGVDPAGSVQCRCYHWVGLGHDYKVLSDLLHEKGDLLYLRGSIYIDT